MKKIKSLMVMIVCVICFIASLNVEAVSIKYVDSTTKLSFIIPDDWKQIPLSEERNVVKAKFIPKNEDGRVLVYASGDVYNELSLFQKRIIKRSDIDNSILYTDEGDLLYDMFESEGIDVNKIYTASYGGTEYYRYNDKITAHSIEMNRTYYIRIYNGYMFMFQFMSLDNKNVDDFNEIVGRMDYSNVESEDIASDVPIKNTVENSKGIDILLGTTIAFSLYSLPIIIYIFVLKKPRLGRKKARKVTIIYGVCSFAVFIALKLLIGDYSINVTLAFICAYINYKILVGDKVKNVNQLFEASPSETYVPENMIVKINVYHNSGNNSAVTEKSNYTNNTSSTSPKVMFCNKCGQKLTENSIFCQYCGTKK